MKRIVKVDGKRSLLTALLGIGAAVFMTVPSGAKADLVCPNGGGSGFTFCYIISGACTEHGDGSASGGGYTMNPGRCVHDKVRADIDQDLVGVGAEKFSKLAREAGLKVKFGKGTPEKVMKKAVRKSLD